MKFLEMIKLNFALFFIPIFFLSACHSIQLDENIKTSEFIHSQKEFGENLKALKYENKFILQIGYIDTTDE